MVEFESNDNEHEQRESTHMDTKFQLSMTTGFSFSYKTKYVFISNSFTVESIFADYALPISFYLTAAYSSYHAYQELHINSLYTTVYRHDIEITKQGADFISSFEYVRL